MCIFIGKIDTVTNTRILVSPLPGKRQLIIYENSVETKYRNKNCMILPVPNGQRIELINLASYPGDLWKDCESFFPKAELVLAGMGFGGGGFGTKKTTLEVQKVGGYNVSIVPTLEDFARLSTAHFVVPVNIAEILKTNYGVGFSFIVCLFDNSVAGHPIAYTSACLPNGQCFIPTRHAHGGDNNGLGQPPAHVEHETITCDGCGQNPLVGVRWKCLKCFNEDFCDRCFNTQKHDTLHTFARIAIPLKSDFELRELIDGVQHQQKRGKMFGEVGEGDFDHTIYVVNSVLAAYPNRYTSLEQSNSDKHGFHTNMGTGFVHARAGVLKLAQFVTGFSMSSISKVVITGDYPNADYTCAPCE